jgi:hypothetical protein
VISFRAFSKCDVRNTRLGAVPSLDVEVLSTPLDADGSTLDEAPVESVESDDACKTVKFCSEGCVLFVSLGDDVFSEFWCGTLHGRSAPSLTASKAAATHRSVIKCR